MSYNSSGMSSASHYNPLPPHTTFAPFFPGADLYEPAVIGFNGPNFEPPSYGGYTGLQTSFGEGDNAEPSPLAINPQSTALTETEKQWGESLWLELNQVSAPCDGLAVPSQGTQFNAGGLALPQRLSQAVSGELIAPAQVDQAAPVVAKRKPGRPRKEPADKKAPTYYYCRYCMASGSDSHPLKSPEGLQKHMAFNHDLLVPGRQTFVCEHVGCDATFNTRADLNKHQRGSSGHSEKWERKLASPAYQVSAPVTQQEIIDTFALVALGKVSARYIVPPEVAAAWAEKNKREPSAATSGSKSRPTRAKAPGSRVAMLANVKQAVEAAPIEEQLAAAQAIPQQPLPEFSSSWPLFALDPELQAEMVQQQGRAAGAQPPSQANALPSSVYQGGLPTLEFGPGWSSSDSNPVTPNPDFASRDWEETKRYFGW